MKKLGVIYYEIFVVDGYINYYGVNDYKIIFIVKYEMLIVVEKFNKE